MSSTLGLILGSSILRKQVVAITGLAMVGFVIAHLAGNITLFLGPTAFNNYAHKVQSLAPLVWTMRIVLITAVILHVALTLALQAEQLEGGPKLGHPHHGLFRSSYHRLLSPPSFRFHLRCQGWPSIRHRRP